MIILTDSMFFTHRKVPVELAERYRLPAIYPISEFANVGGLMFYGANFPAMYHRTAAFGDKILSGSGDSMTDQSETRIENCEIARCVLAKLIA